VIVVLVFLYDTNSYFKLWGLTFFFFFSLVCVFLAKFCPFAFCFHQNGENYNNCFLFFFKMARSDSQFVNITFVSLIKTRILFVSG
jgi:hypothetical protein